MLRQNYGRFKRPLLVNWGAILYYTISGRVKNYFRLQPLICTLFSRYNSLMENKSQWQNLAESYWFAYRKIWPILAKHPCPTIEINNRFTATGGVNYSQLNLVKLSGKFMNNNLETIARVILPHELAHQIDFILHGWKHGARHHRDSWKIIMVKIGLEPDIYHNMVL